MSSEETSADQTIIGADMTSSWEGGRMTYITKGAFGATTAIGAYHDSLVSEVVEPSVLQNVEMIFNFGNGTVTYYINDKKLHTQTIKSMGNLSFALSGVISYFDDLKIEKFQELGMYGVVSNVSDEGIVVRFSDALKKGADGELTIRDIYSNKTITATYEKELSKTIRIIPDEMLEKGCEYEIILPENIQGNEGSFIAENKIRFSYKDSNLLEKVTLKNIYGENLELSETNAPEVEDIVLDFGENVNVEALETYISLTDAGNNSVGFDFSYDDNKVTLTLDRTFFGKSEYLLKIASNDALEKDYTIKILTKEGGINFKSAVWRKDNVIIESIDEIQVGDEIDAELVYVYTDKKQDSFVASGAVYNDFKMIGYDYEVFNVNGENDTYTVNLNFEVSKTDKLKLKGFLWKNEKGARPLQNETVMQ